MFSFHFKRHWFYALAAVVLLLQSFAVWHDAEHAFHTAEAQCERLDAINHLPVADLTPEMVVHTHSTHISAESDLYAFSLPLSSRSQHAIRAPPVFS